MYIICLSLLRRFTFSFLVVCSFTFSSFSKADLLYTSQLAPYRTGQNLQEVCNADNRYTWGGVYADPLASIVNSTTGRCKTARINADARGNTWGVSISGSGCTPPRVYNQTLIGCGPPPPNECTPYKDIPRIYEYTVEVGDSYDQTVANMSANKSSLIAIGGCRAEISSMTCGVKGDGTASCMGVAVPNGEMVEGSDSYPQDDVRCEIGPLCPEPTVKFDSSSEKTCTAIQYSGNGASSYTCVTEAIVDSPGSLKCGSVTSGGTTQYVCTGAPKPTPKKQTSEVTEEHAKTENPDGSTDETKTTTEKVENCFAGKCESQTTVTVVHSGKQPDGTAKEETKQCTGPGCAGGSHLSDREKEIAEQEAKEESESCDPATDPSGCGQSVVTGGATCDAEPVCRGDAVQCSILRQTHKSRCDAELAGDYEGQADDIGALVSGPDFEEPEESIIDLAGIFNTGTRFLPSACPADLPLNLNSVGRTINISWAPLCTLADYAGFLFVAIASLFFVRYVGAGQS